MGLDSLILTNFKNKLPVGSGWGDWDLEFDFRHERIVGVSDFLCYTEHGYTDGYARFKVYFSVYDFRDFRLMFIGKKSQYLNRKYMLREYLEETIAEVLS